MPSRPLRQIESWDEAATGDRTVEDRGRDRIDELSPEERDESIDNEGPGENPEPPSLVASGERPMALRGRLDEEEVRAAVEYAEGLGYRLAVFSEEDDARIPWREGRVCCPLGAMSLLRGGRATWPGVADSFTVCGIGAEECFAFTCGYDGFPIRSDSPVIQAAYELGSRFREEVLVTRTLKAR